MYELKEIPTPPAGLYGVEEPDGTITRYKVESPFGRDVEWRGWILVSVFQDGTWCRTGHLDLRGFESSERIRLLLLMISRDPPKYRALYEKSLPSGAVPQATPTLRDGHSARR